MQRSLLCFNKFKSKSLKIAAHYEAMDWLPDGLILPALHLQPVTSVTYTLQTFYFDRRNDNNTWTHQEASIHRVNSNFKACTHRDRRSNVRVTLRLTVGQYVLVSSPLCGRFTRYCFLFKRLGLKFVVLSLWGALSDERPGLSFVSHSLVICLFAHLLLTFYSIQYMQYIQGLF
jgi:hypothetical protein